MTNIWKRSLSLFLALVMVFGMLPVNAFATETEIVEETSVTEPAAPAVTEAPAVETTAATEAEEEIAATPVETEEPAPETEPEETKAEETQAEETVPEEAESVATMETYTSVPTQNLPSDEELFRTYAENQFYGNGIGFLGTAAGEQLSGDEKLAYDALVPYIKQIASGDRASSTIAVGANLGKVTFGNGSSGVYNADTEIAFEGTTFPKESLNNVLYALLADLPYELYWFDKVTGVTDQVIVSNSKMHIVFNFRVAANYKSGNVLTANTTKTGAAAATAAAAQAIVDKYAADEDRTDYDKLLAYKAEICALTSYNTAAANANSFTTNSDPWQLIYVFDGNTSTKVVCEGYSKAFQYLCDLTEFDGDVTCYSVTGTMSGGTGAGAHMWNIVKMEGKYYLVDVTNSDSGTVGSGGSLFMAGTPANASGSYTFGSTTFTYDDITKAMWGDTAVLTLSESSYDPDMSSTGGMTQEEFVAALESSGGYYNLTEDVTITGSVEIPSGTSVYINAATLTVAKGATLTLSGNLGTYDGSIMVNGTLINNGFLYTDQFGSGASITVNGTLQNGTNIMVGNGTMTLNGTYTKSGSSALVRKSSKAQIVGIGKIGQANVYLEDVINTEAELVAALVKQSGYGGQSILLNADIVLTSSQEIPSGVNLNVGYSRGSGETGILYGLTLPEGVTLTNNGSIFVNDFAYLQINSGAHLVNNTSGVVFGELRKFGTVSGAALEVMGTIIEGEPDPGFTQADFASTLEEAINNGNSDYALGQDLTLSSDLTLDLPDNFVLYVNGSTLTIPSGITLTVNGGQNSSITFNQGELNVEGILDLNTDLFLNDGTTANVSGTLVNNSELHNMGSMQTVEGSTFLNNALVVNGSINPGITMTVSGEYVHGENAEVQNAFSVTESGTVSYAVEGIPMEYQTLVHTIRDGMGMHNADTARQMFAVVEEEGYGSGVLSILKDLVLTEDLTIPANVSVDIGVANEYGTVVATLLVPEHVVLTNNGSIIIRKGSRMITEGTLLNNQPNIEDGAYYQGGLLVESEGNVSKITSGNSIMLTAYYLPGMDEANVTWSISEGTELASIDSSGKLTAKAGTDGGEIVITATPDSGKPVELRMTVIPRAAAVVISEAPEMIDLYSNNPASLRIAVSPTAADQNVTWQSNNPNIVNADDIVKNSDGTYTIYLAGAVGSVKLTATTIDGSKKSASVTINVYYLDTASKLTASADVPAIGLQNGETVQMLVSGTEMLSPENLEFTSSNEEMATVDEYGNIIGGSKTGTVRITAAIRDDPLKRKVTLSVKIIAAQTKSLALMRDGTEVTDITFDKADLNGTEFTFPLNPVALNNRGEKIELTKSSLKWTSSDTKLATVTANADGSATVTIKANQDGVATITAQTTDLAKVTASMTLTVMDRSPRLGTTSITLNPMMQTGTEVMLVSSYSNEIVSWEIASDDLDVDYNPEIGILTIFANKAIKNSTINTTLNVTCDDGNTYPFGLKVTVKNVTPSVTTKQTEKMDLFYTDSEAAVTVVVKDAVVDNMELTDTEDFYMEDGVVKFTQTFIDNYQADPKLKPDTKATLLVYLEGYAYPVEKSVTISTTTSRVTLTTDPASGIVNTALSDDYRAFFYVYNKTAKENLTLEYENIELDAAFVAGHNVEDNGQVSLKLADAVGGTATIYVKLDNWMQSVKLTHKIAVDKTIPTAKLGATTLKLSNVFVMQTAKTSVSLSQSNLNISGFDNENTFVTTAKAGSAAYTEASKIKVFYDGSQIVAEIIDPDNAPKAGTYTYTATPNVDGNDLRAVTIKVNVASTEPKAKLSATTLKLNTVLTGAETATAVVSLTNSTGYDIKVVDFLGTDEHSDYVDLSFDAATGMISATLSCDAVGKYAYVLTPVVRDDAGELVELTSTIRLTVQAYANAKITVSQSASGKLDAINPDSAIVYTVNKIGNAIGEVTNIKLLDSDGNAYDKFFVKLGRNDAGKQIITLTMNPEETYATNQTYKVKLRYTICGVDIESAGISLKVTQSALKLTASTCQYYQSQSVPMTTTVALASPVGAKIAKIAVNTSKTSKELIAALGVEDEMEFILADEDAAGVTEADLSFEVTNPGSLTAGKRYTLYLDVTPADCASNVNPTALKVTVKVAK